MNPTPGHFKICGITNPEDAKAVSELGFGAAGFILHPGSPRYVSPDQINNLRSFLNPFVKTVGVTVNLGLEEIRQILSVSGVDLIQLHGNETPEFCQTLIQEKINYIKAFRLGADNPLPDFDAYPPGYFLLDAYSQKEFGGTGKTVDKGLARKLCAKYPVILSGGINADNWAGIWKDTAPVAMDLSSGVEKMPGLKNHIELKRLRNSIIRY